ncbi:MAG: GTPase HflX [Bacteroidales bacterium]|jgi:GTP-binding protein HflX|nr:GTPase HflX [Bacteroidales bacterium]MBR4714933.1 GTPase HflX [Bacteroidales bacterium]MCR4930933.1 GTPase HflX [Bacteroidales bacterium]
MKQHWKTNKGKFKGEVGVWEPENQRRKSPQERNTFSTDIVPEKAILVSVCDSKTSMERTEECLNELAFLLETAGGVPVKTVIQKLDHPDSRTYIGSGKLEEVIEYKNALDADFLVFDDELTPAQLRNLEKAFNCRILDRTTLILDIFAKRARTSIAKTQVELAQLQYMLPRLTRMWTHLERQRGGIGMRGPGESQIETDRRLITEKITLLKERLKDIDKQKVQQRKNRESLVRVALVGYTNVGKSTLMNLLSKSEVFAENKLFATLDTTVRKVVIDNLPFLLTDTVGFIRKLPHGLVESFKSTLDEVCEADLLMHVVDISHPDYEQQIESVNKTLEEIGAVDKPTIMVFNKIDAYTYIKKDEDDLTPMTKANWTLEMLQNSWLSKSSDNRCIFISAVDRQNIDTLRQMMYDEIKRIHAIRYPYNNFLY